MRKKWSTSAPGKHMSWDETMTQRSLFKLTCYEVTRIHKHTRFCNSIWCNFFISSSRFSLAPGFWSITKKTKSRYEHVNLHFPLLVNPHHARSAVRRNQTINLVPSVSHLPFPCNLQYVAFLLKYPQQISSRRQTKSNSDWSDIKSWRQIFILISGGRSLYTGEENFHTEDMTRCFHR